MVVQNVPGYAMLRDLKIVGKGIVASVFEDAGFYTVSDVRAANMDDVSDHGILKKVMTALERMKETHPQVRDWGRIGRKVYNTILQLQEADVADADVPEAFRCPLSWSWIDDPVITPYGHTYDRVHLSRWISVTNTDPMTRQVLTEDQLIPNRALKTALDRYRPLEERYLIGC
jgi:hypothetical protein